MPGLSCFGNIPWLFLCICEITGCGSASLKLCANNAASPWSQSPAPDSQWEHSILTLGALLTYYLANTSNIITSQASHCIGATIRIGRETRCVPYAGFFLNKLKKSSQLKKFLNTNYIVFLEICSNCLFRLCSKFLDCLKTFQIIWTLSDP